MTRAIGMEGFLHLKGCPECNHRGTMIIEKDGRDQLVVCPCSQLIVSVHRMRLAGIPPEFHDVDERRLEGPNQKLDGFVRRYARALPEAQAQGLSLLLTGPSGTGKTFTSCAAVSIALRAGRSARFSTFSEYLNDLHASYRDNEVAARLQSEQVSALFVMDELGEEVGKSEHLGKVLREFLGLRRTRNLSTIISTKLSLREFEERYGSRAISLVSDRFKVLRFLAEDHRPSMARSKDWERFNDPR